MIPLRVSRAYTGFGDRESAEFVTWLVYPHGSSQFTLWHPESHPNPNSTTLRATAGRELILEFTGHHTPHILRILMQKKPREVILDGKTLPEGAAWSFDPAATRLVIKTPAYEAGRYVISWPAVAGERP